jgi:hypothetical protein
MWQLADHSFYDNADDNCASNYANNTAYGLLNGLFTTSAGSWQCGVTGSTPFAPLIFTDVCR